MRVELPDGRILEFPEGTSQDTMRGAIQRLLANEQAAQKPITPDQAAPLTQDPMLPSPDTDIRSTEQYRRDVGLDVPLLDAPAALQEQPMRAQGGAGMDLLRSSASGLARGATELAALPATVGGGLDALYERLGIIPEGSRANIPDIGGAIRGAASSLTSGATEYQPQTTGGQYAQTVGEFVGGGAGARAGILGGLASEGAGQLTEGTVAEPYARIGAGIAGSMLGAPRRPAFSGDDEAARMANLLEQQGVRNLTAGQARQSQPLMRAEGRLQTTPQQIDDYTASVMRQIGSTEKLATPTNLAAVQRNLVSQMDDAVKGVDVVPAPTQAQAALKIGTDYIDRVPSGQLTPRIRGIANEINALAASNKSAPLSRLREWRSDIGRLSVSPDAATREAAHGLRRLIDDMTDTALLAAGRADDISQLDQARQSYRDFIAVRDAASRAGAEGGTLSPQALNQSVIRSQGREAYATGRTTPMAEFTRAGAATMRPAPMVSPGGARSISEALPMAGAAMAGGGALQAGMDPFAAALLAAGGATAPALGQSLMRSAPVQSYLRNPAAFASAPARSLPGILSQYEETR